MVLFEQTEQHLQTQAFNTSRAMSANTKPNSQGALGISYGNTMD
jgi:hypothetical protein